MSWPAGVPPTGEGVCTVCGQWPCVCDGGETYAGASTYDQPQRRESPRPTPPDWERLAREDAERTAKSLKRAAKGDLARVGDAALANAHRHQALSAKLRQLEAAIEQDRLAIQRVQSLPTFLERFEAWLALSPDRRIDVALDGMNIALEYFLAKAGLWQATRAADFRGTAREVEGKITARLFRGKRLRSLRRKARESVEAYRISQAQSDLAHAGTQVAAWKTFSDQLDMATRGQEYEAIKTGLSVLLKDPRVGLIVGTIDLTVTAGLDLYAEHVKLLDERAERDLSELNRHMGSLRNHVRERNALLAERAMIGRD